MGTSNFVIYVKDNIDPVAQKQISGWNLSDIIKQLNIPEGEITSYGKDVVAIRNTSNAVGASLKRTLGQWCSIESYVEVHPKITQNLGPVAAGG